VVTLRFFAAARAAVGSNTVEVAAGSNLGSTLDAFAAPVLGRCSFLVNGIATTDRAVLLADGDTVDVLPPFAGG
jgi:molybdopterin synthase sulfur carrier subunit